MRRIVTRLASFLLGSLLLMAGWEAARAITGKNHLFTPVNMIFGHFGDPALWAAAWVTFKNSLLGLVFATAIATFLATVMCLFRSARAFASPWIFAFQAIPIVAISPFVNSIFGFGDIAKIVVSCIVCVWAMSASFLQALESVSQESLDLFHVLGANRYSTLTKLRFPSALRRAATGIQIGASLSVVGSIVAESLMAASPRSGIGAWIVYKVMRTDYAAANAGVIMGAIVSLTLVALASSTRLFNRLRADGR
jgi:NitT/TauT family transport system permease protein